MGSQSVALEKSKRQKPMLRTSPGKDQGERQVPSVVGTWRGKPKTLTGDPPNRRSTGLDSPRCFINAVAPQKELPCMVS